MQSFIFVVWGKFSLKCEINDAAKLQKWLKRKILLKLNNDENWFATAQNSVKRS